MPFGEVKIGVKGTALIYTITHRERPELGTYVGHTFDFNSRVNRHANNVASGTCRLYTTIRTNGGWAAFEMKVVGTLHNATVDEARILERETFDRLQAEINMIRPYVYRDEILADKRAYWHSEKGKATVAAYNATPERKASKKKYESSHIRRALPTWECVPCQTTMLARHKDRHLASKKHVPICQPVQASPPPAFQTCELCKCSFKFGYAGLYYHKRTAKHIAAVAAAAAAESI